MRITKATKAKAPDFWLKFFQDYLVSQDLSQATQRAYVHDLKQFAQWFQTARGRQLHLEELVHLDLTQFREHLVVVKQAQPATIKRRMEALRRLCRWAFLQKRTATDLSADLRPVRLGSRVGPKGLADFEIHAFLSVAGASRAYVARRNYAIAQTFLQTGLRLGELAALQVGDAKLSSRVGSLKIRLGKGQKAREVPLNASARRALQSYLDGHGEVQPEEPLFLSSRGTAMAPRSIEHLIVSLARRAHVDRLAVTPHTLRHTFSLNYLKQNPGKLVELATLLGHESLDTTAVYTRPSLEQLAKELEQSPLNVFV